MSENLDGKLGEYYVRQLPFFIGEEGFPNPPMLSLDHDGSLTHHQPVGLDGNGIWKTAMDILANLKTKELVFGLDRFMQPGQGKYRDALTIYWWYGPYEDDAGYRLGTVEYKPGTPPIIDPVDWNHPFWRPIMMRDVQRTIEFARQGLERARRVMTPEDVAKLAARLRSQNVPEDKIQLLVGQFATRH
jgi:hypothetical protein